MRLRNLFRAGETRRWRLSLAVEQEAPADEAGDRRQEWRLALAENVLAVEADGSAHVTVLSAPEAGTPPETEQALAVQRQAAYAWIAASGDMLRSSLANPMLQYALPEGEVEVGETWERRIPISLPPVGRQVFVPYIYTLREATPDGARVEILSPPTTWEVDMPGAPEGVLVTVEAAGNLYFDRAQGRVVRVELETRTTPSAGDQQVTTRTRSRQELVGVTPP